VIGKFIKRDKNMKKILLGLLIGASFGLNASNQRAPEYRWKDEILNSNVVAGVATLFASNLSQTAMHRLAKTPAGFPVAVESTDGRWSRDAQVSLDANRFAQFVAGILKRNHATRKACADNQFSTFSILAKGRK
jgi:hypothetical protein